MRFACSFSFVDDFSTTNGPIQATFCMRAYSGSGFIFSPCGLAAPGGRKRGNEIFVTVGVNREFLHFLWFLSDISATRGRIHTKFYMCRDNVCRRAPYPSGVHRSLGRVEGKLEIQINVGWSHSCSGQLPFLFFSALPDVVQYVGQRPAHILV